MKGLHNQLVHLTRRYIRLNSIRSSGTALPVRRAGDQHVGTQKGQGKEAARERKLVNNKQELIMKTKTVQWILGATVFIFLAILTNVTLSCASNPATEHLEKGIANTASEFVIKGMNSIASKNYQQALENLNKAIEIDPRFAEAYNIRGFALFELGDYKGAINDFDKTLELNPNNPRAYSCRAVVYNRLGKPQEAMRDSNAAIELNPGLAEAYTSRGIAHGMSGNYQEAIRDFDKAIQLNPTLMLPFFNKACAYSLTNRPAEACIALKQAIEKGFNRWDVIKTDKTLDNIRSLSCYKEIISGK